MRTSLKVLLTLAFVAASSSAFACPWGAGKTADSGSQQTVMTDPVPLDTQSTAGDDKKG